jgi:hypothetical protein
MGPSFLTLASCPSTSLGEFLSSPLSWPVYEAPVVERDWE